MNQIGLCIPPDETGEVSAAYSASVVAKLQPSWWYDHRSQSIGMDGFVPMLWDGDVERLSLCAMRVLQAKPISELILMLNEPELAEQANMTPEEAHRTLRRWWAEVPAWVCSVAVAGVNVSVHRGGTPYEWLERFVSRLSDADRQGIAYWHIHAYGGADAFYESVMRFKEWAQNVGMVRPVIVTECGTDDNPAALMQLLRAMVRDGVLHSAAWFSSYYDAWNDTGLLDADGELTEAGEAWMAETHVTYLPNVSVG